MRKIIMFTLLLTAITHYEAYTQKKYGYAVIHFKCGKEIPLKSRIYYGPVIELSLVNFEKYLAGIDPQLPLHSVRYYNYALGRWFDRYLQDRHHLALNDPEKYVHESTMVVFNEKGLCNADKTAIGCFFTDKEYLVSLRNKAIHKSRDPDLADTICEVIDLK